MGIKKIAKTTWRGIFQPIKWVRNVIETIAEKPIFVGVFLFILFGFIVVYSTLLRGKSYKGGFLDNILIEAHGLLFDIFVFGVLIIIFNRIGERKREIKRYQEEINDYRGWDEKEATFRIVGNIKRLNKRDITKINLNICYLVKAKLFGAKLQGAYLLLANLQGADLTNANFQGADLMSVHLQKAYLWQANLLGAKNLYAEQLSKAKTLYEAILNPELEKDIKEKHPHLLEEPELS